MLKNFTWITTDSIVGTSVWGSTNPTSTVFTLNDNVDDSWIIYVWTSVEGFSHFGSYEGGSGSVYLPVDSNRNETW